MAKDSTGTILLLGAAGLAFYGYTQGWFNSLLANFGIGTGGSTTLTAAQLAALQAAAAGQSSSSTPATPPPVPALGTTVNVADALRQVAANDAYIIPDAASFTQLQSALPGGYNWVTTSDKGGVLLRPDVYSAVNKLISDRVARATSSGAAASSIQQAGQTTLAEIQQTMTTAGLSGLGDYNRHLRTRGYRVA